MSNQYLIDWSKWHVKHTPISHPDIDVHAERQCLYTSCVERGVCTGHSVSQRVETGYVSSAPSVGTQRQGALLSHVVDRATATPKKPRFVKYVNPYADIKSAKRGVFRFKGMAIKIS